MAKATSKIPREMFEPGERVYTAKHARDKDRSGRKGAHSQTIILARQERAAAMYLRGETQVEIGRQLGVPQKTVSVDLKSVRERWQNSAMVDFAARKAEELARIDNLERTAWESFAKSQRGELTVSKRVRRALREKLEAELQAVSGPEERSTSGKKKGVMSGTKIVAKMRKADETAEKEMVPIEETTDRVRRRNAPGEVEWLRVVQWCIDKRCAILGLVRPPDVKVENNLNLIDWRTIHAPEKGDDPVEERIQEAEVLAIGASPDRPNTV